MRVALAFVALAALRITAAAEGPADARFRDLERQLRKAQEEIRQLQRGAHRRGQGGQRVPPTKERTLTRGKESTEETSPSSPRSDEPVLLLLEALRKQGLIAESDYQALKQAVVAKAQRDENARLEERRAIEAVPTLETKEREGVAMRGHRKVGPASASYRVGKGLTVRTDDGKFDLTLRNRVQARYTFTDQDDPTKDDTSSFRVRRFKTSIRGHIFYPSLLYYAEVSLAGRPELDSAFLHWRPRRYFGLKVGQYKVPFDRQQLTSSGYQQFVDRSSTSDFFAFDRDQGLSLTGRGLGLKSERLAWDLGIFNGNGTNQPVNENTGHLGVGRVLYMPFGGFKYYVESDVDNSPTPRLGIGAAYAFNSQADSGPRRKAPILRADRFGRFFGINFVDKFDISQATADAQFKYKGLSLLADYYRATAAPNTAPSKTAQGYNVQVGYFLIPKRLEAAFRYAFTDRDIDARQSGLREVGGALGYFFLAHNLKLQMDVRDIVDEAPGGKGHDTMEYRTQLQAIF